jgi:beta-phosphoglucomutase-like phosphatase (HAD superfamily)
VKPLAGVPVEALLCDADGCLFPSEEPAFEASAEVTNGFLAEIGARERFTAEALRLATTGKNFRTTAAALAAKEGLALEAEALERWVEVEREAVTAHLGSVLRPEPLGRLATAHALAIVSSSALTRVDACLQATDLHDLFPAGSRFSAENSLPEPTSKPDPAIYLHALDQLGLEPPQAVAIEDSVPGALAAVGAGCRTLGNVMFVAPGERAERMAALECAGVAAVISSWGELELLLEPAADALEAGIPR